MEVGVCCRQEGGAGSCRLKLRQHKVSERFSEGVGECWQAAAVMEAEHFAMLYQTRDFTGNFQLCSVWQLLCPKKQTMFYEARMRLASGTASNFGNQSSDTEAQNFCKHPK